jgi:Zn-dependent M16 (insulinase) family peptidase
MLDGYLSEFDSAPTLADNSRIATQKKWSEPRRVTERFPVAADQAGKQGAAKHMVSVNWLLNEEVVPADEQLALRVLSYLLTGSTSSKLYKALIESGLGESTTGGGVSDYLLQSTFSTGMKGVAPDNVSKVEELIHTTLLEVSTNGFEEDAVEAALNTIEFRLRESSMGTARGLRFFLGVLNDWNYERDPISGLRFETPLQELKKKLAEPGQRVFEKLIDKYLISNQARLTVEGVPDPELASHEEKSEAQKLADTKQSLTADEMENLVEDASKLKAAQGTPDSPENLAKLPALSLSDLDRNAKELDITVGKKHGVDFFTHEVDSNGVAYVDLAFDLGVLPVEDLPLLPLFTRMMFDVGTSNLSQVAFSRQIGARTGGISVSVLNSLKNGDDGAVGSPDDIIYKLMIRGKATGEKTGDLLQLMHTGLTDAKLDNQKRAVELLKSSKAMYESALRTQGNSFATKRISARHSLAGYIDEITGGTTYFETLKELLTQAQEDWPAVCARLQSLRNLILGGCDSTIVNLSADKKTLQMVDSDMDKFTLLLSSTSSSNNNVKSKSPTVADAMRGEPKLRAESENEGFVVSTLVNHVAKGGTLFAQGEKISGAAQVVQRSLARGYLWDTVRVRGGAYGGSCSLSLLSGTFMCFSYRDPNMLDTIAAYDSLADHLEKQSLNAKEIEQLIIGAVGDLDKPMSPDRKGYVSMLRYLSGETLEVRQARRDQIFATSAEDFGTFAKKLRAAADQWRLSIFGSDTAFTQAQLEDIKLHKMG